MKKLLNLLLGTGLAVMGAASILMASYNGPIPEPCNTIGGIAGLIIFLVAVVWAVQWYFNRPEWEVVALEAALRCPDVHQGIDDAEKLLLIGEEEQALAHLQLALEWAQQEEQR
jgi:hypothetical protein